MIPEIAATPMPDRIGALPRDARGYPIPRFVQWVNGEPNFPVVSVDHLVRSVRQGLCWICGQQLGRFKAFVVGPMCIVNCISSEPPSHLDCAEYAVQVCPFLARPHMRRLPEQEGRQAAPGLMAPKNPGVGALWVTRRYKPVKALAGRPGALFEMGAPERVAWWHKGRAAPRKVVLAAFEIGIARLRAIDAKDNPGLPPDPMLERRIEIARTLLP